MGRGQLEQRLLILVTLGLVAFGLVMVFSATSASATLGEGDPMKFLVKQGLYAVVGLMLLAVLSRVDYHALRPLAPLLLVGSFVACAAPAGVRARRRPRCRRRTWRSPRAGRSQARVRTIDARR